MGSSQVVHFYRTKKDLFELHLLISCYTGVRITLPYYSIESLNGGYWMH